ncbi:hypothetical protein Pan258_50880 [Symmachiella dynata]|nr:hypothetical protein Pan258_50880 [Symmachiella dynata]
MERPLPTLLLVGNAEHAEMHCVAETVAILVPTKQLFRAEAIADIEPVLATSGAFPDLVIVCQTWPDEFTRGEISHLFEMFPLATVLCCFGSWCESDGRNRDLWPPATRTAAAESAGLIRRVWEDAAAGRPPLPATAAIEEVFERQHAGAIGHLGRDKTGSVHVSSADPAIRAWLNDALVAANFQTAAADAPWQAAIWDAPVWDERAAQQLKRFHDAHPDKGILVLIGSMRPHQAQQAQACGGDCVLPKTAPIDTIMESLATLLDDADVVSAGA